jgi:eukaryotic-like serine/threonine-protein kinase
MSSFVANIAGAVGSASQLFGYQLLGPIGEGAGSQIYRVRDESTGRVYALKHVVRKNDKDVRFIEQLTNEYDVSVKVGHPNLRRVVDVKLQKTLLRKVLSAALVMEWFDGTPLDQKLPKSNVEMIDAFLKVADALHAMHKHRFVHCDLKPANILRNTEGDIRVIDLGQACPIGTQKDRIQGTPDFIAPEQVRRQAVDERTDVYNFGATFYWCLCGQKLPTLYTAGQGENSFLAESLVKTARELNPLVPESLSSFVAECCRTDPAKRPASMAVVGQRLDIIRHGLCRVA